MHLYEEIYANDYFSNDTRIAVLEMRPKHTQFLEEKLCRRMCSQDLPTNSAKFSVNPN